MGYDAIYIPCDSSVKIATTSNVGIAEFSAGCQAFSVLRRAVLPGRKRSWVKIHHRADQDH
jgi:hypothetical protein